MEALSVCSDHCRAVGSRMRGLTVVLAGMDVARAKQNKNGQEVRHQCEQQLSWWTWSTRPGVRRALGDGR